MDSHNRTIQEKQGLLNQQLNQTQQSQAEIEGQKNEINEREKTIIDKDNRIYQLKKKTQELEKFKFVLDYKIKELKRDIAPRELEINRLKEHTKDMDKKLKHFNKVNALVHWPHYWFYSHVRNVFEYKNPDTCAFFPEDLRSPLLIVVGPIRMEDEGSKLLLYASS